MTAVGVALALDLLAKEPPPAVHPVVAIGTYLERAQRRVPAAPPARAVLAGGVAWALGAGLALAAGTGCGALAGRLPPPTRDLARGTALWTLLSARMLFAEVAGVEVALGTGPGTGLDAGREALARIVSRDTAELSAAQIRAAALESLAENLSDSVVAPLFWYGVGGLPAAAAYRFANTADACWGYRSPRWRYAGRVAARADDVLNIVPARLTAALLLGGAGPPRWRVAAGQARRTASPNAGWPMAALAVRLDRRLGKPGVYDLNADAPEPGPEDVRRGLLIAGRALALAVLVAILLDRYSPAVGRSAPGPQSTPTGLDRSAA